MTNRPGYTWESGHWRRNPSTPEPVTCPKCNGSGKLVKRTTYLKLSNYEPTTEEVLCDKCNGTGYIE